MRNIARCIKTRGTVFCELVGLCLVPQLQHSAMNAGLYKDDGLAIGNQPRIAVENMNKEICMRSKDNYLNITTESNKK